MSDTDTLDQIRVIVSDFSHSNRVKREVIAAIRDLLGVTEPAAPAAPVVGEAPAVDEPPGLSAQMGMRPLTDADLASAVPDATDDAAPPVKRKPGRPPRVAVEPDDAGEE